MRSYLNIIRSAISNIYFSKDQHDELKVLSAKILIEKYINGRELTVSVIGKDPVALPIIEIKPSSGFYDYESKYTKGMKEKYEGEKIH